MFKIESTWIAYWIIFSQTLPEHRPLNKQSVPQSGNSIGRYTMHYCSPVWAIIHHMILLCVSYHKTIIKIYNYWYLYTNHNFISLFSFNCLLQNYDFCIVELFRHDIVILCYFSHHPGNGHMSGWNLSEATVEKFTSINLLQPTCYVMHQQFNIEQTVISAHALFIFFVLIWQQTATCATYSINWLVFITEKKNVYSAVRTGALNRTVRVLFLNV